MMIRALLTHPIIFIRGYLEGRSTVGITYDNDPWSPRSMAYDYGRTLRDGGK